MLALSCTQFVAQLLPLPAEGTRREAQALLKIAAGPAQWLPAETCLGLDALLPFPRACPSLVATSWSSAMRTSIVTMPRWQTYVDELAAASQRDDALFVHPFAHWMQLSTAKFLATAYARAESLGAVRRREIVDMELSRLAASGSRKFQPRLLFLEQSSHPSFDALRFLERRWSRWFAGAELASCLARSRIIAERLSGYVASCVLHAILISWLNGWCAASHGPANPFPLTSRGATAGVWPGVSKKPARHTRADSPPPALAGTASSTTRSARPPGLPPLGLYWRTARALLPTFF